MKGYLLIITSVIITGVLYSLSKSGVQTGLWQGLAQVTGLLGLLALSWNYVLSIRHKSLEWLFGGLDKVYRVHAVIGATALILLLNHPIFLILNNLPANTIATYLIPGSILSYTLGILALYVLIILVVLSIYVDLPYYLWKQTHEWMGVVIILGGAHAMFVSSDVSRYLPLWWWMMTVAAAGLVAFVYKRYIYYWMIPKNNYRLVKSAIDGEVALLQIEAVGPDKHINFEPGQYGFLEIDSINRRRDEHPFSVLSSNGGTIILGVKIVGTFSLALSKLPKGTEVTVRAPYGTFAQMSRRSRQMVWVAGGIGITPFMSMMKSLRADQRVAMWYTHRDRKPLQLTEIFAKFAEENENFTWHHHPSHEAGRLTAKHIVEEVTLETATFFLCGPIAMMRSLAAQLAELGVRRRNIIFEDFGFK